jgi:O-antigen/teichoic acid export membrane protein
MAESALKQKTAKGLFWGGLSNGVQQLIGVGFGICLSRILETFDYGMVGILAVFTGIALTIITSGFSVALTNKQDANQKDFNAVFWFTVLAGLIIYIILFFCAPLIAEYFKYPELVNLARFLFLGFFFGSVGTVSYTVMFKKLMAKQMAIIEITAQVVSLTTGIILALKGFAYWALAAQSVIYISLCGIIRFIVAPWRPTLEINFSPLKQMFPFSAKLMVTYIFTQINTNIFSIIFGKFYTITQVGIYNQGQKWMWMGYQFIGGMINYVAQPVLVHVNEDKNRQLAVLRKMIRFGAFISFPLMLGLAFVGREFILITIGEKWVESVPFLQLFCLWGAVGFLSTLYTNFIYTSGKMNLFMFGTIIIGCLQLLVVYFLYPYGIFPMVSGYVFMYFVGLMIWQYYVSKLINLRLKYVLKDILPYLVITVGCFFVTWLLTRNILNLYWLFAAKITIFGLLYIYIMKISNSVMFKESLDFLLKFIKK